MSQWFNAGVHGIDNQSIDYLNDTIKVLLVDSTYVHDPDNEFVSDIVADEVPGATRQTLGTKTITKDNTNNRDVFDAADPTFPSVPAGVNTIGSVAFKDTGSDATSTLLWYNSTTSTPTNGGNITIQFPATGAAYGQI